MPGFRVLKTVCIFPIYSIGVGRPAAAPNLDKG